MLYAKGGAAWAGDKYSADLPAFNEHIETSVTRLGWTVGGGLEWAFWNNGPQKLSMISTTSIHALWHTDEYGTIVRWAGKGFGFMCPA